MTQYLLSVHSVDSEASEPGEPMTPEQMHEVYQQVISKEPGGSFDLRPGVKLLLYERRKGFTPAVPPGNPQP
jgi:hypothetical protein